MNLMKPLFDSKYLPVTFTICVRWAPTKPRWVPIAKTKKFRVLPKRREKYPGVNVECRRLYNIYYSQLKGSLELFKTMYREYDTSQDTTDAHAQEEERYWQESLRIIEDWNDRVGKEREQLDQQHFEEEVCKAEGRILEVEEERRKEKERIDKMIREQEELSKNFITPDRLDEHVEKILNSRPHSFNFAIDLVGNIYDDDSRTPSRKVKEDGEFSPAIPERNSRRSGYHRNS